ncbi:MAG TPA: fibronectin type III-like domain-contianing protein, partial [Chitinophagales bacterium]|nr:fibronectin type III-like domain-contianing protein [Chitinophagales bacterium]
KLPFTVPKLESDLPPFNSFEANAEYGYYHGYALFDKEHTTPRYPFGYGLSYTQFTISNIKTSEVFSTSDVLAISVKVKNTGDRSGAEVVQVYVSPPKGKVDVPEKLLRAFQKVYLQPGEEKTVELTVPVKDLAYYDEATKSWIVEKGKYEVLVGNSSRDEGMVSQSITIK